jgi:hypothetical protein
MRYILHRSAVVALKTFLGLVRITRPKSKYLSPSDIDAGFHDQQDGNSHEFGKPDHETAANFISRKKKVNAS